MFPILPQEFHDEPDLLSIWSVSYTHLAMLDGLIDRMEAELGEPATLVATGGMSRFITPLCTHKIIYDADLLLRGLLILYRQNMRCV